MLNFPLESCCRYVRVRVVPVGLIHGICLPVGACAESPNEIRCRRADCDDTGSDTTFSMGGTRGWSFVVLCRTIQVVVILSCHHIYILPVVNSNIYECAVQY